MVQDELLYDELCLSVYNTNRYFHRLYDRVLDQYDLSYLQYMSLLIIHQRDALKMMDIGMVLESYQVTHSRRLLINLSKKVGF